MVSKQTWKRVSKYGVKEIVCSLYLWIPIIITGATWLLFSYTFSMLGMRNFVHAATGTSQSLIAVTLSGLAILVSFSDRDFLTYFTEYGGFDELLLIFEYTVLLSIWVTLFGVFLQSVAFEEWLFYVFLFIFLHLLASIAALVETILRFAKSKSTYDTLRNIDENEIPDELKKDMERIFSESSQSLQDEEVHDGAEEGNEGNS